VKHFFILVDPCSPEVWAGWLEAAAMVTAVTSECVGSTQATSEYIRAPASNVRWPHVYWQAMLYAATEADWKDYYYVWLVLCHCIHCIGCSPSL